MITRYRPAKRYPFCAAQVAQPTYAARVQHEEAAQCVSKLLALATPPPYRAERRDTDVRATGPLLASSWLVYNAKGQPGGMTCLQPHPEHEGAVLSAWRAFSSDWQRRGLGGAVPEAAAGMVLVQLTEAGALDVAM